MYFEDTSQYRLFMSFFSLTSWEHRWDSFLLKGGVKVVCEDNVWNRIYLIDFPFFAIFGKYFSEMLFDEESGFVVVNVCFLREIKLISISVM